MTYQPPLFNLPHDHVVNVASVPHRSPFRYPGGKTWFVPRVRAWLRSMNLIPTTFLEPFAGGAIVGLTVAFERLAGHVTLVEKDEQVANVWQTILQGDAPWLVNRILNFDLTPESVLEVLSTAYNSLEEKAFQTILKNRTSHGGIMADGAGLIKNGEAGKGVASRWYPTTLANRITDIVAIRDRVTIIQGDGLRVIKDHASNKNIVAFIDPPYTAGGKNAGSRLYTYNEVDHAHLFDIMVTFNGDFLMTYDIADEVKKMSTEHGFSYKEISMQNTHLAKMKELVIGRNLEWL